MVWRVTRSSWAIYIVDILHCNNYDSYFFACLWTSVTKQRVEEGFQFFMHFTMNSISVRQIKKNCTLFKCHSHKLCKKIKECQVMISTVFTFLKAVCKINIFWTGIKLPAYMLFKKNASVWIFLLHNYLILKFKAFI